MGSRRKLGTAVPAERDRSHKSCPFWGELLGGSFGGSSYETAFSLALPHVSLCLPLSLSRLSTGKSHISIGISRCIPLSITLSHICLPLQRWPHFFSRQYHWAVVENRGTKKERAPRFGEGGSSSETAISLSLSLYISLPLPLPLWSLLQFLRYSRESLIF